MFLRQLINSRAARTLFYIIFVGGLLVASSLVLCLFWNLVLVKTFRLQELSMLEASGLIAFLYVFYFGFKFGEKRELSYKNEREYNSNSSKKNPDNELIKKLSMDEKEELMTILSKCCRIKEDKNQQIPAYTNIQSRNEK